MSDELLNEFIFDSREHLGTAGSQLLELEKHTDSLPVINALMGTLHTIKGTSGFFDLKHLYELLNRAENLLQTVREKEGGCPQKVVDLLLQVLDTVEAIIDRLENGEDDQVDWIGALTQALSECETALDGVTPAAAAAPAAKKAPPAPAGRPAAPASPPSPKAEVEEDLHGQISQLKIDDGQLAREEDTLPDRVEAMFEAGLAGLVMDLRDLASVTGAELRTLMALGRKSPGKTAFLLDAEKQSSLYRVFMVLSLDSYMKFFSDADQALNYIKSSGE